MQRLVALEPESAEAPRLWATLHFALVQGGLSLADIGGWTPKRRALLLRKERRRLSRAAYDAETRRLFAGDCRFSLPPALP